LTNSRIVSVVGAGPAGLSASIQLSRFGISHFIFEKSIPGGLLRNGNLISNYTGVFPPVTGARLAEMMTEHYTNFSRGIIYSLVNNAVFDVDKGKFVVTAGGSEYFSDFIIAASGTRPVKPEIIKTVPDDLMKYIDFCVAGLKEVEKAQILIVGAGDSAFDYALSLSALNHVEIINRSERIKALHNLRKAVLCRKSIKYRNRTELGEIKAGNKKALNVRLIKPGEDLWQEFDRIIFAIGREPEDAYLEELKKSERDSLIRKGRLFLSGDINKARYRQALIAAGDGLESAMKINDLIEGYGYESRI